MYDYLLNALEVAYNKCILIINKKEKAVSTTNTYSPLISYSGAN